MKKICIITATRAEYGLLKPLMTLVQQDKEFELQLIVTGAHLSSSFGETWKNIETDGFNINKKIEILLASDTAVAVSKAMGLAQISFAEAFDELKPDLLVVLGDRYEMLAVASAALIANIPIVHLHGGELTQGAIDDAIRHAITKMSVLHFASTDTYRNRIIQMGEAPETVFNVGAIGLDNVNNLKLLDKTALEESLGIKLKKKNFIVTFHPETKSHTPVEEQINELLSAVDSFKDTLLLFSGANADTNGLLINNLLKEYAEAHKEKSLFRESHGQLNYLSCLKHFDVVIGNSSSGIIEAPSFKIPVVNIGDRQKGRILPKNIIGCPATKEEIISAINTAQSNTFKESLRSLKSPYGTGNTAGKIMNVLKTHTIPNVKTFYEPSTLASASA